MNGTMNQDIPLGFRMALMQNPEAMRCYSNLSDVQKQAVIDGTHAVQSKEEMRRYVENLTR